MKSIFNNLFRKFADFFGNLQLALGSILTVGLGFAIAALFFFAWLADEMLEGDTARFDEAVRGFVQQFISPTLTAVMKFASFIGSVEFLIVLGLIFLAILLYQKRRRGAIIFAVATIGSGILLSLLKLAFKRTRPESIFDIVENTYSFPSGHALGALCFYLVLAAIVTYRIKNRALQILIWLCAILTVLLIGISRIYLGVHFPSDIVAGYVVGIIWTITIAVADKLYHVRDRDF